jgi:hypothetical protein
MISGTIVYSQFWAQYVPCTFVFFSFKSLNIMWLWHDVFVYSAVMHARLFYANKLYLTWAELYEMHRVSKLCRWSQLLRRYVCITFEAGRCVVSLEVLAVDSRWIACLLCDSTVRWTAIWPSSRKCRRPLYRSNDSSISIDFNSFVFMQSYNSQLDH